MSATEGGGPGPRGPQGVGRDGGSGAAGRDGDLELVVRRLYEQPPEGFVAARAAAVDEARRAGDRDAAKLLGALRKPTVAGWLINLLALRRPELLDELVELSTALRAAQRDLHGDQLRELSTQRRQVVAALVAEARRLAVEADGALDAGRLPLADVETTLTAALSDADVAGQVRSGRLIRAVSYAGFGEVPRPRLRLVTTDLDADDGADTDDGADADDSDVRPGVRAGVARAGVARVGGAADRERVADVRTEGRRRELRRQLDAARAGEERTRELLEEAESAEHDAAVAVAELDAAIADLERQRAAAHGDVAHRKLARRAAQRDVAAARRLVGDLQAALEHLEPGG